MLLEGGRVAVRKECECPHKILLIKYVDQINKEGILISDFQQNIFIIAITMMMFTDLIERS